VPYSNTVTIVVSRPKVGVSNIVLTADKTEVEAGEAVNFTATVYFTEPLPSQASFYLTVYVNNNPVKDIQVTAPAGSYSYTARFQLSFDRAGTYFVKVSAPDEIPV